MANGKKPNSSDNNLWAAVAYLLAFIVPALGPLAIFFIKKEEDASIKFHAAQALILNVAVIVVALGIFMILTVLSFIPGVNIAAACILTPVMMIGGLGMTVYYCLLAYKTYKGEDPKVPYIAEYAKKLN
ncbi:hypothetical protein AUJ13_02845 [Candidatus Micrarchaeota archaeon CG1_02_49_24]|nr:MAG: hypothetical protein AUJ13_02845 [Candidatus Micrarchaeota archaeon CG1_02_49_24]PIU82345.1 MAG: hypothetical protein COS70_01810 [Candidatus Micrarchaeota archaeon CG06_land_8_20_14_3_00_50_6]HII53576.1 DUF4870 domain-containing protein [Candidatus Micrarchaeota archaeon]